MRLLFAGTPETAVPSLLRLLESDHEVVAVLTQPARPRGRSSALVQSPVAAAATAAAVPVFTPQKAADFHDQLVSLNIDLAVVVAYGQLLPAHLLDVPRFGWINLHFSLLPLWRGAAPVQRAVMAGDSLSGASVFQLEVGMDTGPVFGTLTTEIGERESAGELLERLATDGAELLLQCVDGIANGTLVAVPQAHELATHAAKLDSSDAQVLWAQPAAAIDRLVRGCTPAPGAWTWAEGKRLELGPLELVEDELELSAGELRITKREVLVGTGSHPVRLGKVKPAGGKWMDASDWARGLRGSLTRFSDSAEPNAEVIQHD